LLGAITRLQGIQLEELLCSGNALLPVLLV
jgi:hypothetical protein